MDYGQGLLELSLLYEWRGKILLKELLKCITLYKYIIGSAYIF